MKKYNDCSNNLYLDCDCEEEEVINNFSKQSFNYNSDYKEYLEELEEVG